MAPIRRRTEEGIPSLTILGAGSWGTALALHLAKRFPVTLWARDPQQVGYMAANRENSRYLPGFILPEAVHITGEIEEAVMGGQWVFLALPVAGLREALENIQRLDCVPSMIVMSKGIEKGRGMFPHQLVASLLPKVQVAVLSGPTFAIEIAKGLPAAAVVAGMERQFVRNIVRILHSDTFRVYPSNDVIGLAVAGAIKNVIAISTGLCDSLNLGLNARAALLTRGLSEMSRVGRALGAQVKTFMGLAGMGDLLLTATGDLSRNRQVGLRLGRGETLADILQSLGHVSEGVVVAEEVLAMAKTLEVDVPIIAMVVEVIQGLRSPKEALQTLLQRPPRGTE